jgi:2-dehydropantoate 2-reductase
MRGPVGQVPAAPGEREFVEGVVAECAAVAAASGQPVRDSALNRTLTRATGTTEWPLWTRQPCRI